MFLDPAAVERDLQFIADLLALHIVVGVDIQHMIVLVGFYECAECLIDIEARNHVKIQRSVIHHFDGILEMKIPHGESARCGQFLTIQPVDEDAPAFMLRHLCVLKCLSCRVRHILHRVDFPAIYDVQR